MGWLIALLILALSSELHAAALGLPENTARVGYAAGMSRLSVDDPAGSTKAKFGLQPVTLIYTDWMRSGGLRYWLEVYYTQATLDPGPTEVGQDASRAGLRAALQRNIRVGAWSPWLGLGLDVSRNRFSQRHTEDSEGFLLTAYPDRSVTGVGLVAHVMSEWAIAREWDVHTKLEQVFAVSGGMNETSVSIGVLYRY